MTPPGGGAAGVAGALPPVVEEAAGAVGPALREACERRLSPTIAAVVGYHLGWLDADGRPAGLRGGKSVRAALALCSARAAGADPSAGIPGAVGVELVHTFSLLHDDIMDGDRERHGRPAAWTEFGRPRAILAGDAVLALAYRVLFDAGPVGGAALGSLAAATERLIDGQALDLDLEGRADATPEDCIRMCAGKTGALLECAASIGALLAGAGDGVVEPLGAFGRHLGLAFQAVDDLLGIWGDPAVTGKPVFGDLVQRKTSLPVAMALASGGEGARELAGLLGRPSLDVGELERAAALVAACGGRAGAEEHARAELARALAALDATPIDPDARADLGAIARFVAARDF
jgi:geranylgeranyl diphosphate synthase, type I